MRRVVLGAVLGTLALLAAPASGLAQKPEYLDRAQTSTACTEP